MLSTAWARDCAGHYLRNTAPDMPLVSPLFASLKDLPPTLIQAGTDELLHNQALQLHDALEAAAVEVCCDTPRTAGMCFKPTAACCAAPTTRWRASPAL
jgi:acetyl esterase/lipase